MIVLWPVGFEFSELISGRGHRLDIGSVPDPRIGGLQVQYWCQVGPQLG